MNKPTTAHNPAHDAAARAIRAEKHCSMSEAREILAARQATKPTRQARRAK